MRWIRDSSVHFRRTRGQHILPRFGHVAHEAGGEEWHETLTHLASPGPGPSRVGASQRDDVVGGVDHHVVGSWHGRWNRRLLGGECARGADVPTREQTIGVVVAVDRVAQWSVEVDVVLHGLGAERMEVEPAVAPHEWIERPRDRREVAFDRPATLVLLHPPTESGVLQFGDHSGDVRMQTPFGIVSAEHTERRAYHPRVVECAHHVAVGVGERHEEVGAHEATGGDTPHPFGDHEKFLHLGETVKVADLDGHGASDATSRRPAPFFRGGGLVPPLAPDLCPISAGCHVL